MTPDPETTTERVALVVFYLMLGVALTTKEAARLAHISRQNAHAMLCRISRVVPIYQDDDCIWRRVMLDEELK